MLLINEKTNAITLTRGDTLTLTVELTKDGDPYVPEQADVIRFAVSKKYLTDIGYELVIEKEIPHDTLTFTIPSEETKIPYNTYNYDLQITHGDNCVDTFISSTFTIVGEVE